MRVSGVADGWVTVGGEWLGVVVVRVVPSEQAPALPTFHKRSGLLRRFRRCIMGLCSIYLLLLLLSLCKD
jgi:hypothetical protein